MLNQYIFTYFVSPNYFGIVDLETTHFVGHIISFETQKHKSMLLLFFPTLFYFVICDSLTSFTLYLQCNCHELPCFDGGLGYHIPEKSILELY